MPTDAIRQLQLRIPDPLLARVRVRAAAHHRSLNGELLTLLERGLGDDLHAELRRYVRTHPQSTIMEIMAEFELTDQEAIAALQAAGKEPRG